MFFFFPYKCKERKEKKDQIMYLMLFIYLCSICNKDKRMIEPKIVIDRYVSPLLLLKCFVFTITSGKKKEKRTKITKICS
jgi:hypothetical protein